MAEPCGTSEPDRAVPFLMIRSYRFFGHRVWPFQEVRRRRRLEVHVYIGTMFIVRVYDYLTSVRRPATENGSLCGRKTCLKNVVQPRIVLNSGYRCVCPRWTSDRNENPFCRAASITVKMTECRSNKKATSLLSSAIEGVVVSKLMARPFKYMHTEGKYKS